MKTTQVEKVSVIFKILGLFNNPLTADDKYSILIRGNLFENFHIQVYQKQKIFSQFLFAFSKFAFNFQHFQKKIILIADVFLNLRIPKNLVS